MKIAGIIRRLSGASRTLTILATMLAVVGFAQALIMAVGGLAFSSEKQPAVAVQPATQPAAQDVLQKTLDFADKQFLPDGTAYFVNFSNCAAYRTEASTQKETAQVYDAEGKQVWQGPRADLPYNFLVWAERFPSDSLITENVLRRVSAIGVEFSRVLQYAVLTPDERGMGIPREWWRYDLARRQFIGTTADGQPLAYCGPAGFASLSEAAGQMEELVAAWAWYPRNSSNLTLLWQTRTAVYEISFAERRCERLLDTGSDRITELRPVDWADISEKHARPMLAAYTEGRQVHVVLREPNQHVSFTLPKELWWQAPLVAATRDGVFVKCQGSEGDEDRSWLGNPVLRQQWVEKYKYRPYKSWASLYRLNEDGTFALVNKLTWTSPAWREPYVRIVAPEARGLDAAVRACSPGVYSLVWRSSAQWALVAYGAYDGYDAARFPYGWSSGRVAAAHALKELAPTDKYAHWVIAAMLACAALLHQWPRRTSWVSLGAWAVVVLFFSLPGLLAYWAMNHVPVIRCPSCGRKRGLNRPDCRACRSPLPPPKPRDLDLTMIHTI